MKKFKKLFLFAFSFILFLSATSFIFAKTDSTVNKPAPKHKIYFCTYGDKKFKESRKRIANEAKKLKCFDGVHIFTPEKISKDFKTKYKDILAKKRGGGYWIWKYDVLKQMLELTKEGDYIFYSDAGSSLYSGFEKEIKDWVALLEKSKYKNLSFQMKYIEKEYTVNELFKLIESKYPEKSAKLQKIKDNGQLFATAMLIKNDKHSRSLIQTCLDLIDFDHNIITDKYNGSQKNKKFKENRHDQSILSCVRKL